MLRTTLRFILLSILAGFPAAVAGQDPCAPAELAVGAAAGLPGAEVAVDVSGGVSCEVTGFSLAVGYDGSRLHFDRAEPAPFLLSHAGDQLYFYQEGSDAGGYIALGAIFDLSFPLTVPPVSIEAGTVLAKVVFRIDDQAAPGEAALLNRSRTYGAGNPVANIFSGRPGEPPVEPALVDGAVTIEPVPPERRFLRADANGDLSVDLADGVFILDYLFLGGERPACLRSADANGGDEVDIADAIYLIFYLFLGQAAPPSPFPACGPPPGPGVQTCDSYPDCG